MRANSEEAKGKRTGVFIEARSLPEYLLHMLNDISRLSDGRFGDGFDLFSRVRIGLELSVFDVCQKSRIAHGFLKSIAEYF